jgi:hypothetical protein
MTRHTDGYQQSKTEEKELQKKKTQKSKYVKKKNILNKSPRSRKQEPQIQNNRRVPKRKSQNSKEYTCKLSIFEQLSGMHINR